MLLKAYLAFAKQHLEKGEAFWLFILWSEKQNLSFLDTWAQPLYGGQKQGSMMVGTVVKVEWIMIMTLEESARYSTSNLGLCHNFTAVSSPIMV